MDEALRTRWLELTRDVLPARARAERWVLREDHCFQRVVLDRLFEDAWYDHVPGRPAYRHLTAAQLQRAVDLAEQLVREGDERLREWNADSLRWRGKRR